MRDDLGTSVLGSVCYMFAARMIIRSMILHACLASCDASPSGVGLTLVARGRVKIGGSCRICISDLRHKPSRFIASIVTDRGRDADTLYGCPALPA